MSPDREKRQRLLAIAKMYYEENMVPDQVARQFRISRPMLDKLLLEARLCGIVQITICDIGSTGDVLSLRLMERFKLKDAIIVNAEEDETQINQAILREVFAWLQRHIQKELRLGIGGGPMLDKLVDFIEKQMEEVKWSGVVCPFGDDVLLESGRCRINEFMRILADRTHLEPMYLHVAAIKTQAQRKQYMCSQEFRSLEIMWNMMDLAILDISGMRAQISMEDAMCVSVEALENVPAVLAVCEADVDAVTLLDALRTGRISHVALSETLALEVLRLADEA